MTSKECCQSASRERVRLFVPPYRAKRSRRLIRRTFSPASKLGLTPWWLMELNFFRVGAPARSAALPIRTTPSQSTRNRRATIRQALQRSNKRWARSWARITRLCCQRPGNRRSTYARRPSRWLSKRCEQLGWMASTSSWNREPGESARTCQPLGRGVHAALRRPIRCWSPAAHHGRSEWTRSSVPTGARGGLCIAGLVQPGSVCNDLRYRNDPIRLWRTRLLLLIIGSGSMLMFCTLWAVAPFPPRPTIARPQSAARPQPLSEKPELRVDLQAFSTVNLWNPPPAPPKPQVAKVDAPRAAPPPKPLRAQLLAIVGEGAQMRASLFDLTLDCMVTLGVGERLGDFSVTAIRTTEMELSDGNTVHRLRLREEGS